MLELVVSGLNVRFSHEAILKLLSRHLSGSITRLAKIILLMAVPVLLNAQDPVQKNDASLVFETAKGNCLACHEIEGGTQMGDIGPPLVDMATRFPDRERLYQQIWDASKFNVDTLMPPYGRHDILTSAEINTIIDFLYTK